MPLSSYEKTSAYAGQTALADFCRTGSYTPIAGAIKPNVDYYRRLVVNVVSDNLNMAYPLAARFLGEEKWDALVDDFWKNCQCSSPLLWMMPKEFYAYLIERRAYLSEKYFFLFELLRFEWLEIEHFMQEDTPSPFSHKMEGDMDKEELVINPELAVAYFEYPVFKKKAEEISEQDKGKYYLAIFRCQDEDAQVMYTELSPAFVRLIEILQEKPLALRPLSERLCSDLGIAYAPAIADKIRSFVKDALASRLLSGFCAA